ncbi:hypothetical protein EB75_15885 [Mycobacterium sp. ST-F2]|nr:hypothetical protein EB75_15885 [Mycobacterium sp. ST-F2]
MAASDSSRATHLVYQDDPRRALVRKRIVNDYLNRTGTPSRDGVAVITAGVPGAGKSEAVNAVLGTSMSQYRRLDADVVKDDLLEDAVACALFNDILSTTLADGHRIAPRELAPLVHHESTRICDVLRRNCIDRGEQIVIEGTLSWPPLGTHLLAELGAAGYSEIHVIAVEVPESVAQQRAIGRWWSARRGGAGGLGGRFTPPGAISRAYHADGRSVCLVNAVALVEAAADDGFTVTLDVVDATGTVVSTSHR